MAMDKIASAQTAQFFGKGQNYEATRTILGVDFISADEIAAARGLAYTEDQLIELGRKLPDQATLEALRDNDMMLVAGPPTAMTMLDVRAVHADFFYVKGPEQNDSGWYEQAHERFARTNKVEALCWIAFRKEPVEDSLNKTWPDQRALVVEPMLVPNAAEAAWALTTYKAVRDICLLDVVCVRTSSVDFGGHRVNIGDFGADGLRVDGYWDFVRCSRLGVSAARKF